MKYKICCHTRDFEYLNDWIEHHLELGFDKITIYDNLSVIPVIYDHPKVEIIRWNQIIGAMSTYNDYVSKNNKPDEWTAFIDEDEFINTKGRSIQEAMNNFLHFDSLGLNWKIYGDKIDEGNTATNIKEKYLYHVPEDFEKLNPDPNNKMYIKTIARDSNIVKFVDPHYPVLKPGKRNSGVNGQTIIGSITEIKDVQSTMWIDHYHFRGLEDYVRRQSRYVAIVKTRSVKEITDMYNTNNPIASKKRV